MSTRKTIGLALGSGVYRGFAHIGVINVLEKNGIPIDYLSGASIGALVAAYYAAGGMERLTSALLDKPWDNLPLFSDFSLTGGFIGGRKLWYYLEDKLPQNRFSALKTPLQIVATDLISGQPFIFKSGNLAEAVRASISVPLVFKPVPYKDKLLVDGGLSNPVPVNLVRNMGADIVIGVNLYNKNEFVNRKFTMPNIALRTMRIALHNLSKIDGRGADVVIEPDTSSVIINGGLSKYFTKEVAAKLIAIGEAAAEKALPEIKRLLA